MTQELGEVGGGVDWPRAGHFWMGEYMQVLCGIHIWSFHNTELKTIYICYFDPAIPFLGILPKKTIENVYKYLVTKTFPTTLFLRVEKSEMKEMTNDVCLVK